MTSSNRNLNIDTEKKKTAIREQMTRGPTTFNRDITFTLVRCVMRRDYDIFEKWPDDSTIWRACVHGQFEAIRKVQELAELSENEFVVIDFKGAELSPAKQLQNNSRPFAKTATHG